MDFTKALLKLRTSTGVRKVDTEAQDRNSLTPLVGISQTHIRK